MFNKDVFLSVIVPVYNVEAYLDQCVQSLLGQTMKDLEIILVDDGSSDGCPIMCDNYASDYENIKVVHKANAGLGMARNSGLDVATGLYVTFIDSDDFLERDAYECACNLLKEYDLDEIRYQYCRFSLEDGIVGSVSSGNCLFYNDARTIRKIALEIFDKPADRSRACPYEFVSSCTGIYRRSIIEDYKLRFYSERKLISEDSIFNFDFLQHAQKVAVFPHTYYRYRVNAASLTNKLRLDRVEKAEVFTQFIVDRMKQNKYTESDLLYAWGFYVNQLRACSVPIFNSDLPLGKKRAWWLEQVDREF